MMSPGWVLLWSFLLFLVMNLPVAVSFCLATWLTACLAMGSLDIAAATVSRNARTARLRVGTSSLHTQLSAAKPKAAAMRSFLAEIQTTTSD